MLPAVFINETIRPVRGPLSAGTGPANQRRGRQRRVRVKSGKEIIVLIKLLVPDASGPLLRSSRINRMVENPLSKTNSERERKTIMDKRWCDIIGDCPLFALFAVRRPPAGLAFGPGSDGDAPGTRLFRPALAQKARPTCPWDIVSLGKAPQWTAVERPKADGVQAVTFAGLPFHGKPTRVFAWLGCPKSSRRESARDGADPWRGGTAFDEWVRPLGPARVCRDCHGHLRTSPVATTGSGFAMIRADRRVGRL